MRVDRFAAAVALLAALGPVAADTAGKAAAPSSLPDCWVEHSQVQPAPVPQGIVGDRMAGAKHRLLAEQHVGAEHPPSVRPRSCNSAPPEAARRDRAPEPRPR